MTATTDHKACTGFDCQCCNWCGHMDCNCKKGLWSWSPERCDCTCYFEEFETPQNTYPVVLRDYVQEMVCSIYGLPPAMVQFGVGLEAKG